LCSAGWFRRDDGNIEDDCGIANAIGQLTFPYLVSGPRAAEVLPTMRSSWNFRPQRRLY
jgi:hypothetical protein